VLVELSADKNASYGTVVAIVDAARVAGIHNITAFTQKSVTGKK
jgi:biopolymer transport protein ExbD